MSAAKWTGNPVWISRPFLMTQQHESAAALLLPIGILLLLLLALFVLLSVLLVVLIAVFHFQEPPVVNFAIPFAVVVCADSSSLSV